MNEKHAAKLAAKQAALRERRRQVAQACFDKLSEIEDELRHRLYDKSAVHQEYSRWLDLLPDEQLVDLRQEAANRVHRWGAFMYKVPKDTIKHWMWLYIQD